MIRFHFHELKASHRVGPHRLPRGTPCCHVYSTDSHAELLTWGRRHGFTADWLHDLRGFVHFDAWGERLEHCGEGGGEATFRQDVAAVRRRMRGTTGVRSCCRDRVGAGAQG